MPINHRANCTCSVCLQKLAGIAKRADLDRKRAAIARMQLSHKRIKDLDRMHPNWQWVKIAETSSSIATIAQNVAKIAYWTIPTLLGIGALIRALMYIF